MAKVGRAARVASRQRTEEISASKTIESAETGETYLVSALCTITLPVVQDGAYFRFVIKDDIAGLNSANLVIRSSAATEKMAGFGVVTIVGTEDFVPRKGVMTRYAKKMVRPDMYGLVIVRGLLGEQYT